MIIDGKIIAAQIQEEIRQEIRLLKQRPPCLAMVLVGNHPPSQIYVTRKAQACEQVGMRSIRRQFDADITEHALLQELARLNKDDAIDGILLQLPLPSHINPITVMRRIEPTKDVDGLHPENVGKLLSGDVSGFVPCTPLGIKVMMERAEIDVSGKHVLIMGRSNLVGKPMAALLIQNSPGANATVTIVHRYSENTKELTRMADVIIAAMGNPRYVTADMIKKGAVVIDVGINKIPNPSNPNGYQIVGDVDFENVKDKCSFITPVPGGVGPMTIAMLLQNTLQSYRQRHK